MNDLCKCTEFLFLKDLRFRRAVHYYYDVIVGGQRTRSNVQRSAVAASFTARVAASKHEVDRAINNTIRAFTESTKPRTAQDLLALMRFPSQETLQISRAAEIFERTLEVIYNQEKAGVVYNISSSDNSKF